MLTTIIALGVAGLLLLFLEMFLPGLIAGIIGGVLLILSVVFAYRDLGSAAGNLALLLAATSSGALWWWWANHFQKTRLGRAMTLEATNSPGAGMTSLAALTGQYGEAITPLRPSGTILVAGKRIDAVTDGEFVAAGSRVLIIRTEGHGAVVRESPIASAPAAQA
jgi:membrane-bound serine protease (ClpP class)